MAMSIDWISLLSAISGLILGALGTRLAYKSRSSLIREQLYTKQVEVYSASCVECHRLYALALRFMGASDEEKEERKFDLLADYLQFVDESSVIGAFAPTGVFVAHTNFIALLGAVLNPYDSRYGQTTQDELAEAYYLFINSVRRSMGVDALSEEIMGMYEKPMDRVDYLGAMPHREELMPDVSGRGA